MLWLFAFYVGDIAAAALGLVWIGGRILYLVSYSNAAERRGTGFTVQAGVCVVLLIGALGRYHQQLHARRLTPRTSSTLN